MNMAMRVFIVGLTLAAASWNLRADEDKKELKKEVTKEDAKEVKKTIKDQVDFTYLNKYWGLKLKDIAILPARKTPAGEFIDLEILFEFERSLTANEAAELRDAISQPVKKVHFALQDKDNIIFSESKQYIVEGVVSGIKGDAIRLRTLDVTPQTTVRAEKIIARQFEP